MAAQKLVYFLLFAALFASVSAWRPPVKYDKGEDLDDDEDLVVVGKVVCFKLTSYDFVPLFGITVKLTGPFGFSKSGSTGLKGEFKIKGGSYKNAHLYRLKVDEFTLPYECSVLAIPNPGSLTIPLGVKNEKAFAQVAPFVYTA